MPDISACAVERVAPGASRPNTPSERTSRLVSRSILGHERSPHVGVGGESHALRHDADDYGRDVVDLDRLAENRRVAAVAVLPDRVAEDDDGRRFRTVFPGSKVAAQERWLTQQLERVRRDARTGESFGGAAGLADVHRRRREDRHALKRVRLGAPVLEIEEGDAAVVSSGDAPPVEIEELVGVIEG